MIIVVNDARTLKLRIDIFKDHCHVICDEGSNMSMRFNSTAYTVFIVNKWIVLLNGVPHLSINLAG